MSGDILVALDLSERSAIALAAAVGLAKDLDRTVLIAHVMDEGLHVPHYAGPKGRVHIAGFNKHLVEDAAIDLTNQWAEAARLEGVDVESMVLEGRPGPALLQAAKKRNVSMIVAATHGHKFLSRLVMGSVCEELVRRSEVPVLVVPIRGKGS